MRSTGSLAMLAAFGLTVSLGACVTVDDEAVATDQWLAATNFFNGVEESTPLPEDQVPSGNVQYDGAASLIIDSLGDVEGADRFELVAGSLSAEVGFSDNTGSVEITNLGVIQIPNRDDSEQGPVVILSSELELISDVTGGFSGTGQVLVDANDSSETFDLSGEMSGAFSDGTTFDVSGDLTSEMSVQFDEESGTTYFLVGGAGEVGDNLEIAVDGASQDSGGVSFGGVAVEGGF